MANGNLSAATVKEVEGEIERIRRRGRANKRLADTAGAAIILLGCMSGLLLAIPDALLNEFHCAMLRQVVPVFTAAAYATLRYYRWGDKHKWYFQKRRRLQSILVRDREGDSVLSRELASILNGSEDNYPQAIYPSAGDQDRPTSGGKGGNPPPQPPQPPSSKGGSATDPGDPIGSKAVR